MSINGTLEIISLSDESLRDLHLNKQKNWEMNAPSERTHVFGIKKPSNETCTWIFKLSVLAALIGGPIPTGFHIAALNTSQVRKKFSLKAS